MIFDFYSINLVICLVNKKEKKSKIVNYYEKSLKHHYLTELFIPEVM